MRTLSSKLQKDILINVVFAFINMVGVVVLTRMSTSFFAPAAFGLFMLVRKYSTTMSTFADLGGSIAQYRYMGMFADEKPMRQLVSLSVLIFYLSLSAVIAVGAYFGQATLLPLLLPGAEPAPWILWYSIGLGVQNLLLFNVGNNLLQERKMILYNLVAFMNGAGIFILIFSFFRSSSVQYVLLLYLILGDIMALVGILYYNAAPIIKWFDFPWHKFRWIITEVFSYGFLRGFGSALTAGLFVVGPWLIRGDLQEVGYLIAVFLFMQTTAVVIQPITRLSMVVSARNLSEADDERLASGMRLLFAVTLIGATIFMIAAYPLMDILFNIAIGNKEIIAGAKKYSIVMTCVIPFSVFTALKGVIDMRWKTPFNVLNLVLCQIIGLVLFYLIEPTLGPTMAVIAHSMGSFWTLGFLTVLASRVFLRAIKWSDLISFFTLALIFLVGNYLVETYSMNGSMPALIKILVAGVTVVGLPTLWWLIFKPVMLTEVIQQTGWAQRFRRSRQVSIEG